MNQEEQNKEFLKQLLEKGKVTIKNPYLKDFEGLAGVIRFLNKHKQPIPKLLKELCKGVEKKLLSWKL